MKKIFLIALALSVFGCGGDTIPDQLIDIRPDRQVKLKELGTIKIIVNRTVLTIECNPIKPGQTGYYLLSSDTSFRNDYAKWKCAHEMQYLHCPDLSITFENKKALVEIERGGIEDYSRHEVERCINYAIDYAPTTLEPTSKEVRNRDSWN